MKNYKGFISELYLENGFSFEDIALRLFQFQSKNNRIFEAYLSHIKIDMQDVRTLEDIPFLPIEFFKKHIIQTGTWNAAGQFTSSGTGGVQSTHHYPSLSFYHAHTRRCFEFFFGALSKYRFFALLPSYLERSGSSLISMMDFFMRESGTGSGFYLHNHDALYQDLMRAKDEDDRIPVLWGASFALLDFAEDYAFDFSHGIVVETGGMKGRRKELVRQELHGALVKAFNVANVYSEYGMTELFSQAYSTGNGQFQCPPWMKVVGRSLTDPAEKGLLEETAGINIIDLANIHSQCFIETQDVGVVHRDGNFEILGRVDNADVRGCNLLIT